MHTSTAENPLSVRIAPPEALSLRSNRTTENPLLRSFCFTDAAPPEALFSVHFAAALLVATTVSSLANLYTPLYRTIQPLCNLSLFSLCTMITAFISLFLRNAAQGSICIYHYRRGSLQLVELSILNAKNGLKYGMDKLLENEICGFGGSVAKGLVGLIFNARVVHEFWRPSAS